MSERETLQAAEDEAFSKLVEAYRQLAEARRQWGEARVALRSFEATEEGR